MKILSRNRFYLLVRILAIILNDLMVPLLPPSYLCVFDNKIWHTPIIHSLYVEDKIELFEGKFDLVDTGFLIA